MFVVFAESALEIFKLMFTNEICQYISDMTNKYAENVMGKKKLKPNSRMKRWKPITLEGKGLCCCCLVPR